MVSELLTDRRLDWRRAAVVVALTVTAPVAATAMVLLAAGAHGLDLLTTAVRLWLFAVGGSLTAGGVTFSQVPIGGALIVLAWTGFVVRRTASHEAAAAEPGVFAALCGGLAAVVAGLLSAVTEFGPGGTSVVRSTFGAFAVVGGATAVTLLGPRWRASSTRTAYVLRAALVGVLVVLGVSFCLVLIQLARGTDDAALLWAGLGPDLVGAFILGLLCLLSLPTLTIWASCVLIGPGVRLGSGTHVDLTGVDVGALPAFPTLVVVGAPGPHSAGVLVLGLVPVVAGAVAGWRCSRAATEVDGLARKAADGAIAGAVAGVFLGVLASLTAGPIGPGVLTVAGPPRLEPLLVATFTLAVAGAIGAVLAHYRGTRANA